jgi:hypothetical protein
MDPVSLGSLIVAIVVLAWTIYSDLDRAKGGPTPETLARQVRVILRGRNDPVEVNKIVEVVAAEIIGKPQEANPEEPLEGRIDRLSRSFQESARLIEQVSAELEARSLTARRLKEEAENAEALARLHKDEADAVRRVMRAEMHSEMTAELTKGLEGVNRRNFRDGVKISVASFLAGGVLTVLVTLFIH